jgi:type I restriction enzyme M protein
LAQIVTGKTNSRAFTILWFWSLLLRVAKEVKNVSAFLRSGDEPYHQLCRMNMIMHDVHYKRFDIKNEDTLERPLHLDYAF